MLVTGDFGQIVWRDGAPREATAQPRARCFTTMLAIEYGAPRATPRDCRALRAYRASFEAAASTARATYDAAVYARLARNAAYEWRRRRLRERAAAAREAARRLHEVCDGATVAPADPVAAAVAAYASLRREARGRKAMDTRATAAVVRAAKAFYGASGGALRHTLQCLARAAREATGYAAIDAAAARDAARASLATRYDLDTVAARLVRARVDARRLAAHGHTHLAREIEACTYEARAAAAALAREAWRLNQPADVQGATRAASRRRKASQGKARSKALRAASSNEARAIQSARRTVAAVVAREAAAARRESRATDTARVVKQFLARVAARAAAAQSNRNAAREAARNAAREAAAQGGDAAAVAAAVAVYGASGTGLDTRES